MKCRLRKVTTNLPVISGWSPGHHTKRFLIPFIADDSGDAGLTPRRKRSLAVLVRADGRRAGHVKLDGVDSVAVETAVCAAWWSEGVLARNADLGRAVDGWNIQRLFGLAHLARVKVRCVIRGGDII